MNALTKKTSVFSWDSHCDEAFEALKQLLTQAPILAYPNYELPFYLYVDASLDALGATLGQVVGKLDVVVAYGGHKLSPQERNYSATEREALAVLDGIKHFRTYLYGHKFFIVTDHHALKWLMNIKEPTGRLAHWSLEIQQHDFEVIYCAGRLNGNADALSRYPYESLAVAAMSSMSHRAEEIRELQNRDPQIAAMIDYLTLGFLPPDEAEA